MKVFLDVDGSPQYETFRDGDYTETRPFVELPDNTDLSNKIVDGGVLRDMTQEEIALRDSEEAAKDICDQICALEDTVTPRREREALLTVEGKEWLQDIDDQIAALRAQL